MGRGPGEMPPAKLREVVHRLDLPPLPETLRKFIDWVAGYTLQPAGAVLRMALNPARRWIAAGADRADHRVRAVPCRGRRQAHARARKAAGGRGAYILHRRGALARAAGVSAGVVRDLITAGALTLCRSPAPSPFAALDPDARAAASRSRRRPRRARSCARTVGAGFSVTVLEGVTGSGKTEVYLEAVAAALTRGQQVLVLVPEIALTAQSLARFVGRFGVRPAEWHSDLNYKARRETWLGAATGDARVVIGARSALYLPFRDLALIVVDEEHEGAFKQEEGVIYHARDMAIVRAREGAIPIVLASATPSLETIMNVRDRRYGACYCPSVTAPRPCRASPSST